MCGMGFFVFLLHFIFLLKLFLENLTELYSTLHPREGNIYCLSEEILASPILI